MTIPILPDYGFSFHIPAFSEQAQDILGLWTITSTPSLPAAAFSGDSLSNNEQAVWQISLPENVDQGSEWITIGEARLQEAEAHLKEARPRLDAVLQQVNLSSSIPSFARPLENSGVAETKLWQFIAASQDSNVSFGMRNDLRQSLDQASREVAAFFGQLRACLNHFARVETALDGTVIASTLVGWTGDVATCWNPREDTTSSTLHLRALSIAITSRAAWIRLGSLLTTGVTRLILLLGNPLTAPLALPAVWKFVRDILSEINPA